jgi:hypothetical protein
MSILESLRSGAYDDMNNNELYDHILEKGHNFLFSSCHLVLNKINKFESRGAKNLQDKGLKQLHQREERDVRDLRRNVEQGCDEFLRSLGADEAPFHVEEGEKGLFTSDGLTKSLLFLGPFEHHSGLLYNLRLSLRTLVHILNDAYTCQGKNVYKINKYKLAWAFRRAADHLEWALAQHIASTQNGALEEDQEIPSQLDLPAAVISPQGTTGTTRPGLLHTETAPNLLSTDPQSPPTTPARRARTPTTPPPLVRAAKTAPSALPVSPAELKVGIVLPIPPSPVASTSRYRRATICTTCKLPWHRPDVCPKTKCFNCK